MSKYVNSKSIEDNKDNTVAKPTSNCLLSTKQGIIDFYRRKLSAVTDTFIEKIDKILRYLHDNLDEVLTRETIYFAFTGGKDCLAAYIIIKLYYFLKAGNSFEVNVRTLTDFFAKFNTIKVNKKQFKVVYFMSYENFEAEEDYVIEFCKMEDLEVFYVYTDFVKGLKFMINKHKLTHIIMGTRSTDLKECKSEFDFLQKSTYPYPEFNRIYPVFHFNYEDIWRLILLSNIYYFDMYNKGYSSIGKVSKSRVNDNLIIDNQGVLPAWCLNLEHSETERSYR